MAMLVAAHRSDTPCMLYNHRGSVKKKEKKKESFCTRDVITVPQRYYIINFIIRSSRSRECIRRGVERVRRGRRRFVAFRRRRRRRDPPAEHVARTRRRPSWMLIGPAAAAATTILCAGHCNSSSSSSIGRTVYSIFYSIGFFFSVSLFHRWPTTT